MKEEACDPASTRLDKLKVWAVLWTLWCDVYTLVRQPGKTSRKSFVMFISACPLISSTTIVLVWILGL